MPRAAKKATTVPLRGRPDPPLHLNPIARKKFRDVARQLDEAGLLSLLDRDLLTCYCATWYQWRKVQDLLKLESAIITNSNNCIQKNPAWNVSLECVREMRACLSAMGMSPAAREKLHFDEAEEVDPFADCDV